MNMKLFENIAQLTNLQYDNTVVIKESLELKEKRLQSLIDAGLCPSRKWLNANYPQTINMDLLFEEDKNRPCQLKFPPGLSIFSILGEYYSATKEIFIYVEMCRVSATKKGVDVDVLMKVIEAHEVSHAVTHLGTDIHGGIWENFDKATSEDKEFFAQIYPLLFFNQSGDIEADTCFRELSKHQRSKYNSWRCYDDINLLAQLNRKLLEIRLKSLVHPTIPKSGAISKTTGKGGAPVIDTIVVPAQEEPFEKTFLGENRWWAIRMHPSKTQPGIIKYIVVYREAPTSAVTHCARVKNILPWQNTDKFVVNFAEPAWEIPPIAIKKFGEVKSVRSRRYTSFAKLQKATTVDDLF